MTDLYHPITPSPELIEDWIEIAKPLPQRPPNPNELAALAAQWGADAELEACCAWLEQETPEHYINALRLVRRPKPPSLKEQALQAAQRFYSNGHEDCNDEEVKDDFDIIRRALESLPD
jgi:hypothetical protein